MVPLGCMSHCVKDRLRRAIEVTVNIGQPDWGWVVFEKSCNLFNQPGTNVTLGMLGTYPSVEYAPAGCSCHAVGGHGCQNR